jgi:hypothetical protein
MSSRRILGAVLSVATVLLLSTSFAGAAKIPTYQVYKKCSTSSTCSGVAYLNKKRTRVLVASTTKLCPDNSWIRVEYTGTGRISRKGKFDVSTEVTNWDVTNQVSVKGTGRIKGKLKKKNKRLSLSYSVEGFPPSCASLAKGTITLKYKGTQTGG